MKQMQNNQNKRIQNFQYWASYAKKMRKLILFYGQNVLDLTNFAPIHPAGQKAISTYLLQDVKNILFRVYPHPSHSVQILSKYCIGKLNNQKNMIDVSPHKGICKQKSNICEKKQGPAKKVSFEFGEQKQNKQIKKNSKNPSKYKKQINKENSVKLDQNFTVLQENKPNLMVPHFQVKFDCFQIIKIQTKETL